MSGNFLTNLNIFGRSNANNTNGSPQPAGAPAQPQYQTGQQQLNPQNNNNPAITAAAGAGNNEPANNAVNNADPTKGTQGSQLDSFKDIFNIPTDDSGKPAIPNTNPLADPIMSVDPQKLREAAGKMDFTRGLEPELLQKAMSGQDPQAFMQVLNSVAQNGFSTALAATATMQNQALSTYHSRLDSTLPSRVRDVQISQAAPKNPALAHPSAQPVLSAIRQTIAQANPHLSPEKVAEHAENYFTAMAADMQKATEAAQPQKKTPGEVDWLATLSS